jgi:hypothetical protein
MLMEFTINKEEYKENIGIEGRKITVRLLDNLKVYN